MVLLVVLPIFFTGCAGNYGKLDRSMEVKQMFESLSISPNYRYYYSGPESNPFAILGIQKDYELKSSLWKSVDLNRDMLESWMRLSDHGSLGFPANGYYILSPDGNPVGVWYSIWTNTTVKFVADKQVIVHTPTYYPGSSIRPNMDRGDVSPADSIKPVAVRGESGKPLAGLIR